MDEIDVFNKLESLMVGSPLSQATDSEQAKKIADHRAWLRSIRHERPSTQASYRIGVYIRFFIQTKYQDYLEYHKKQFSDTVALCPNWTLVDFYIDHGSTAPNMETAPEWSRLVQDCFAGRVDLIITQKVSNVTRKPIEITILAGLLAAQKHPVGIYFISEDIFTLASYYQEDMRDTYLLPRPDWQVLPDDDEPEDEHLSPSPAGGIAE